MKGKRLKGYCTSTFPQAPGNTHWIELCRKNTSNCSAHRLTATPSCFAVDIQTFSRKLNSFHSFLKKIKYYKGPTLDRQIFIIKTQILPPKKCIFIIRSSLLWNSHYLFYGIIDEFYKFSMTSLITLFVPQKYNSKMINPIWLPTMVNNCLWMHSLELQIVTKTSITLSCIRNRRPQINWHFIHLMYNLSRHHNFRYTIILNQYL